MEAIIGAWTPCSDALLGCPTSKPNSNVSAARLRAKLASSPCISSTMRAPNCNADHALLARNRTGGSCPACLSCDVVHLSRAVASFVVPFVRQRIFAVSQARTSLVHALDYRAIPLHTRTVARSDMGGI